MRLVFKILFYIIINSISIGLLHGQKPIFKSFTPSSGTTGTQVTLSGNSFTGVSSVKFGNTEASSFTINNDSTIQATVGTGSTGIIKVTNSGGSDTSKTNFTFTTSVSKPVLHSFNPKSGLKGTKVTIYGANFNGTSLNIYFGNVNADSINVINDTTIIATVSNGSSGYVKISNQFGKDSLSGFTYILNDPPKIIDFSPKSGTLNTLVNIKGKNFLYASDVKFGNISTTFYIKNDSSIDAYAVAAGAIKVINSAGYDSTTTSFNYTAPLPKPKVNNFSPSSGGIGTQVRIGGQNFINTGAGVSPSGLIVRICGNEVPFVIQSDTSILATIGISTPKNNGIITVINASGYDSLCCFQFITQTSKPTLTTFNPLLGQKGDLIRIRGKNFLGASDVLFGDVKAESFNVRNDTLIDAYVGIGSTGKVKVINSNGYDTSINNFTFINGDFPIKITSFSPINVKRGDIVTIIGKNFTKVSNVQVRFGGSTMADSTSIINDTLIYAKIGKGTSGFVTLITPFSIDSICCLNYVFINNIKPKILSFTPQSATPGSNILIYGEGFTGSDSVFFGKTKANKFNVLNDSVMYAEVSNLGSTGKIIIHNKNGSDSSTLNFVFKDIVSIIKGVVYYDKNQNGKRDTASESLLNMFSLKLEKNNSIYNLNISKGVFEGQIYDTGVYKLFIDYDTLRYPNYKFLPKTRIVYINKLGLSIDTLDFALQKVNSNINLTTSVNNLINCIRPGFESIISISINNLDVDTVKSVVLHLNKNKKMLFVNTSLDNNTPIGDTLILFTINKIPPLSKYTFEVRFNASVPPILNLNDTIIFKAFIDKVNSTIFNNSDTAILKQIVTGSFDPNDIANNLSGKLEESNLDKKGLLNYTIRFQNTGNDTAFNIIIKDTLSKKYNLKTFSLISASHDYQLEIIDSQFLLIRFPNIKLVDSIKNEKLSHGYIKFSIDPIKTLQACDLITNSASIYFDYNPPIMTNLDTLSIIKSKPIVRDTIFCKNSNVDSLKALTSINNSLLWYGKNSIGGVGSKLSIKPNTDIVGSLEYYVSQISTTGCESPRAKITVSILPLPIAPIVKDTSYCNNASSDTIRLNASTGTTLLWYGTNATGGTSSTTAIKPSTASVGAANYYLSQIITATGCEGPRSKVVVTTKPIPSAPTLSRDTANYLLTGTAGTSWYKDGSAITDTTQKYKPATPGSYTAKTTTNGCISVMSSAYYYLVTDIINLSKDEFIKLAPNPFINQLNFDFVVKGYQKLNLDIFELASGRKVTSRVGLTPGSPIYLPELPGGIYIMRVTSNDNKLSYQFKMLKL